MASTSDAPRSPSEELGSRLVTMRRAKKLTGTKLAEMVGMSQPKISRIENGAVLPDPADIAKIARALGADEAVLQQLVQLAEQSHDRMTDWRSLWSTLASTQHEIRRLEAGAKQIRDFQSAVVPGLLQTSEYARAILTSFQPVARLNDPQSHVVIPEAVSARIQRQEILGDLERSFEFVMTEAVLGNRICPPEGMAAQLRRIRDLAAQSNITVAIVPAGAEWTLPPMHAFNVFDEETVMIELLNTGILSHGRTDIRAYSNAFDVFRDKATLNIDPILDDYLESYLEEARPKRASHP
jgi:transcriptional regulator with XRE-family HTH domain